MSQGSVRSSDLDARLGYVDSRTKPSTNSPQFPHEVMFDTTSPSIRACEGVWLQICDPQAIASLAVISSLSLLQGIMVEDKDGHPLPSFPT